MALRDNQDIEVVATSITSANLLDNQEVLLPVTTVTSALLRCNQEVMLVVIGKPKYYVTYVVT